MLRLLLSAIVLMFGLGLFIMTSTILYKELFHSAVFIYERVAWILIFSAVEIVLVMGVYFIIVSGIPILLQDAR